MNTVQRSPRRMGADEPSASSANSPTMLMPSFSACSSRNEPVPAAHASFMAKSTTMPSCRLMNLLSWPPISKIVSHCLPILRPMKSAPVLWAVISSVMMSAPVSSPMSSRPEPVVPTPSRLMRAPISAWMSASPLLTTSTGRASVLV